MGRPILGSSHIFIKFAYDNFTLSTNDNTGGKYFYRMVNNRTGG